MANPILARQSNRDGCRSAGGCQAEEVFPARCQRFSVSTVENDVLYTVQS
jgi:hypothetical protein